MSEADVPKLVIGGGDEELDEELETASRELAEMAEKSVREKNIADMEKEIGNYEERKKARTLPEGVRDERDFEEYAEEKRARAREEKISEAREDVDKAYEDKQKKQDVYTVFQGKYPEMAAILLAAKRRGQKIETGELLEKMYPRQTGYSSMQQHFRACRRVADIVGANLDDIERMGVELDARCVEKEMSKAGVALNADMLEKHGAKVFIDDDMKKALSNYEIMSNYEMLVRHGFDWAPLKSYAKKVFEESGAQPIMGRLDYLLKNGMTIGQIVRILDAEAIAENYDVLKAHGARVVNPLAHAKISKKKKAPQEQRDYIPGFIELEDGPGGYPDWLLKK